MERNLWTLRNPLLKNFRFVPGKHVNSVCWVSNGFGYRNEKGQFNLQSEYDPNATYFLRCKSQKEGCPGRAKVENYELFVTQEHKCQPNEVFWQSVEARELIKAKISVEASSYDAVYNAAMRDQPFEVTQLVTKDSVMASMKRARKTIMPVQPPTFRQLAINFEDGSLYPEKIQKYFIGSAYVTVEERELTSIIIGDPDILKPSVLTSAKEAFCDATFYVAPSPCPQDKESQMRQRNFQLLNIAYQDHGHLVPLFHAVMNSRRISMYEAVFNVIRRKYPLFDPDTIMMDFEYGMRSAFRKLFTETRILGCRFHYGHAVYGKIASLHLLRRAYRADPIKCPEGARIGNLLKQYLVLPFLSSHHIRLQVLRLERELRNVRCGPSTRVQLQDFHTYFVKTWMKRFGCTELSLVGVANRTNNSLERFHRVLKSSIPGHLSFFEFVMKFSKDVFEPTILRLRQQDAGQLKAKGHHMSREEKMAMELINTNAPLYESNQLLPEKYLEILSGTVAHLTPQNLNDGRVFCPDAIAEEIRDEYFDNNEYEAEEVNIVEDDWHLDNQAWLDQPNPVIDPQQCTIRCKFCNTQNCGWLLPPSCSHVVGDCCQHLLARCPICGIAFGGGTWRQISIDHHPITLRTEEPEEREEPEETNYFDMGEVTPPPVGETEAIGTHVTTPHQVVETEVTLAGEPPVVDANESTADHVDFGVFHNGTLPEETERVPDPYWSTLSVNVTSDIQKTSFFEVMPDTSTAHPLHDHDYSLEEVVSGTFNQQEDGSFLFEVDAVKSFEGNPGEPTPGCSTWPTNALPSTPQGKKRRGRPLGSRGKKFRITSEPSLVHSVTLPTIAEEPSPGCSTWVSHSLPSTPQLKKKGRPMGARGKKFRIGSPSFVAPQSHSTPLKSNSSRGSTPLKSNSSRGAQGGRTSIGSHRKRLAVVEEENDNEFWML